MLDILFAAMAILYKLKKSLKHIVTAFNNPLFVIMIWSSRKALPLTKSLVILFPFSLSSYKNMVEIRRMNSENRDQKSCLSARSHDIIFGKIADQPKSN